MDACLALAWLGDRLRPIGRYTGRKRPPWHHVWSGRRLALVQLQHIGLPWHGGTGRAWSRAAAGQAAGRMLEVQFLALPRRGATWKKSRIRRRKFRTSLSRLGSLRWFDTFLAEWRNGRRWGLKIPWGVTPVRVRVPPRLLAPSLASGGQSLPKVLDGQDLRIAVATQVTVLA
jgi:hypothetical protein